MKMPGFLFALRILFVSKTQLRNFAFLDIVQILIGFTVFAK